jgi:hypothetical protein
MSIAEKKKSENYLEASRFEVLSKWKKNIKLQI